MNVFPVISLITVYMYWIKPRLLCSSASENGRSLLVHLCNRSRILIPMIVFSAFWLFDAQMEIEYTFNMIFRRGEHIINDIDNNEPAVDIDDESDTDDSSNLPSDDSSDSDLNMMEILDMQMVLNELVNEH